jgi:hypothetical protein
MRPPILVGATAAVVGRRSTPGSTTPDVVHPESTDGGGTR